MRLGVWLTRRQIRAVIRVIKSKGLSAGLNDAEVERLFEALNVLEQVEVDDPPPRRGPKCPEPECGHSLAGHRFIHAMGRSMCQISDCRCGRARRLAIAHLPKGDKGAPR